MKNYKVGIIGATGMVGQRFVTLLANHPWFTITAIAASGRNKGKTYAEAVEGRWKMSTPMPESVKDMVLYDAENDAEEFVSKVDFTFCAVNMKKDVIRALEEKYAKLECPVVSNNSAHRFTKDVPMIIPEVNAEHVEIIPAQRKRLGTQARFHRSKVQLLHPVLCSGSDRSSAVRYREGCRLHVSGNFRRWQDL